MEVILMDFRTVALLDILGFKNRIKNTPLESLAKQYERAVAETANALNKPMGSSSQNPTLFSNKQGNEEYCKRFVFSDSIILFSNDHSEASALKLLIYTWRFMQALLGAGFPVRGGIAYGEVYVNPSLNVFLGKGLTSAYELEQKQNWIGVSIDESVIGVCSLLARELESDSLLRNVLWKYDVPFKNGQQEKMHTINWRFNLIVERGTRSLFKLTGDKNIDVKIDNTLEYAKHVIDSGEVYCSQEGLPIELGCFWIGSKEPPFPHGDDL